MTEQNEIDKNRRAMCNEISLAISYWRERAERAEAALAPMIVAIDVYDECEGKMKRRSYNPARACLVPLADCVRARDLVRTK